ncbi:MAG: polyprenyl synthetase family protein [Phycisphaerae bacterium]
MSPDDSTQTPDCHRRLRDFAVRFDRRFDVYLSGSDEEPAELLEALRYSALGPGKRLRPFLVVRTCELVGGTADDAWPAAAAVECVHAFSLIHDDLPAMDDDDLRRGRSSCHRRFGEAMAILAGDALLARAFELLARHVNDRSLASDLMLELAVATGSAGMIGGQAEDILGQSSAPSLDAVQSIHLKKTARLFEAACRMGGMTGGADSGAVDRLACFGRMLGRCFQIADDLLDLTADPDRLGKSVGKDDGAGKQTYPRYAGAEESRQAAADAVKEAVGWLTTFGPAADDLRALAKYVAVRDY